MLDVRSHHDHATDELVVRVHDADELLAEIRLPAAASLSDVAHEFQAAVTGQAIAASLAEG